LDGIVCGGDMAGGAVAFAIAKLLRNVPSAGGQMNMHEPQFDGILMLMQIDGARTGCRGNDIGLSIRRFRAKHRQNYESTAKA